MIDIFRSGSNWRIEWVVKQQRGRETVVKNKVIEGVDADIFEIGLVVKNLEKMV